MNDQPWNDYDLAVEWWDLITDSWYGLDLYSGVED